MNCKKAQKWISLEMDGELPSNRMARLEEHLGGCDACRGAREAWTGFSNLLGNMDPAPAYTAEAALADVQRGIRNEVTVPADPPIWALKPAWISAAAALLLAVGLFAFLNPLSPSSDLAYNANQTKVESVEIGVPNSGFMVMEDAEVGMTMIWIDDTVEEDERAGS